jgi:virginiamycin B lyase
VSCSSASRASIVFTNYIGGTTGRGTIGRITTTGEVADFDSPQIYGPDAIVSGPDNGLWFTNHETGAIGRISVTDAITVYSDPFNVYGPDAIAPGAANSIWFTGAASTVGVLSHLR